MSEESKEKETTVSKEAAAVLDVDQDGHISTAEAEMHLEFKLSLIHISEPTRPY